MKKFLFTLLLFSGYVTAHAQTSNYYLFKKETQAYAELTADTTVAPANFGTGDMWAFTLVGEQYSFFGKNYAMDDTKRLISFSNSGHMRIDDDSTLIIIDGLFYYMDSIDQNSKLSYKIDGSGNNKILKVQWKNLKVQSGPAGNFVNFQIWIHQATGIFEIRYGTSSVNNQSGYTNQTGPNIGMFYSRTDFTKIFEKIWITGEPANYKIDSARNYTFNGSLGVPADGTVYRFVPKTVAVNIHTIPKNTDVLVYPNPAVHNINISMKPDNAPVSIEMTDVSGKVIFTQTKNAATGKLNINTEGLTPGMYQLTIKSSSLHHTETISIR